MSSSISTNKFYTKKPRFRYQFKSNRAVRHVLQAVRTDATVRIHTFPTQQQAFDQADKSPLNVQVWSNEIDTSGKRQYSTGSYDAFWRFYTRCMRRSSKLHFYEVIRNRRACKLYFDLEYKRAENVCDAENMIESLVAVVSKLAGTNLRRHSEDVVELDSTTEKKFSRHLVFESIAFYDNIQAGLFAQKVVDDLREQGENLILVNNDGVKVSFVDLGVYTKNRCFRIIGSSKFGKAARLLPLGHEGDRLSLSKDDFLSSLVCSVKKGVTIRGKPSPSYMSSGSNVRLDRMTPEGRKFERDRASPHPRLDEYIFSIIEPHGGGIYGITIVGEHLLFYAIKGGYKYCENIGRHHKSNNVLLVADIHAKTMYQKCFDPDCRGFRSPSWSIPTWVFEEIKDDDLYRLANEIEDTDGGITDSALNTLLDGYVENTSH
ncbi:DNA-directed primase/polymerase protein isoform X1 [Gracilaria domingensis]|nr:DNA-directed primase/polymerase protein isoform X1 [Gracilaria domingensis]